MVRYEIVGNDIQFIRFFLDRGEGIYTDAGYLMYKDSTVSLNTTVRGGFTGGLSRMLTGETLFTIELYGPGEVGISSMLPGKIVPIRLDGSFNLLVNISSFLAAETTVNFGAKMSKLSATFLAGLPIVLERFTGTGMIFLHAFGDLIFRALRPGEILQVDVTHLLAFVEGTNYTISRVGGIKSMIFSGEGFFFITFKGPGYVWLRGSSIDKLVRYFCLRCRK